MIALFFFILGLWIGWYVRGTRFAVWLYKWFRPDATAVKETGGEDKEP